MEPITEIDKSRQMGRRALIEELLTKKRENVSHPFAGQQRKHEPRPLSFSQESLWFFDQFQPGSPLYNLPQALRLRGHLNHAALQSAFDTIVLRHESLRTRFVLINEKPAQVVAEPQPFTLPIFYFTSSPEPDSAAQCWVAREARRPFDLATDLMIRAAVLRLRDDEHILFLCVHHIAADAWSLVILNRELTALYKSFCAGELAHLPELKFQYSDFALYQRERFQGEFGAKQIAYWKEQLAGELPVIELPDDRAHPIEQTFRGAVETFQFSKALSSINKLSRRENTTVYSILLAAFQILLQRHCRQDDILVGSPIGARSRSDAENLIGYFINVAVLRGNLSGNPTFQEFLRQVHGKVIGALCNPDVSLERLVEELKIPRHAGRNPLVQVLFQFLAAPIRLPQFEDALVETFPVETQTSKFDLTMTLRENAHGFYGEAEFNSDIFDRSTIRQLFQRYEILLQSIVANPSANIGSLSMLTKAEEHQLLHEWNPPSADWEDEKLIHNWIEKQASRVPEQIAVRCGDDTLSYAELDRRSNQLANHLRKIGVRPDALVGICLQRSVEMIVAIVGVLKSGGAYVPLDPEYPQQRLSMMLDEIQSPVVLTRKCLRAKLPPHRGETLCLDEAWPLIEKESAAPLESNSEPENLAYVIFTSGSTGRPKGVLVTHRNLFHSTRARAEFYPEPVKNFLLLPSFAFDSSVAGIFWTLTSGGQLTLPKEGSHQDPAEIAQLIGQTKVSHTICLPSFYNLILSNDSVSLGSLETVVVAGESCGHELIQKHAKLLPGVSLVNEYGPTEAAIWSTAERLRPNETGPVTIGKPIRNVRIYILDTHHNLAPPKVPGEIYIGGAGVVRGYLNRPELTAEKFIEYPFGTQPGERLYRTGDLARFLSDGRIEFLGRIDHQVKLRGYRIELEEIESVLREIPTVRQAVVVLREESAGNKDLVAYVTPTGVPLKTSDLREHLKTRLPQYMMPSGFVVLENLPLTPNGKVNRNALPAPKFSCDEKLFVPPRTPAQEQLAQIWREVLHLQQVGIHDNFFELGGHSLLATQVVLRIRSVMRVDVPLREFFTAPTIPELAEILERRGEIKTIPPTITPLARKTSGFPATRS